jgi:hypothetical protein
MAASIVLQMDGLSVLSGGRMRLGGSVESDPKEHVLGDSQFLTLMISYH